MAETKSRTPGVIRSTREFFQAAVAATVTVAVSPEPSSPNENNQPPISGGLPYSHTGSYTGILLSPSITSGGLSPTSSRGQLSSPSPATSSSEGLSFSPALSDTGVSSPLSTSGDDLPTTSNIRENPRELRNKAEKQRRDKLNQSISDLATIVPPVAAATRRIDKISVLRLTAHYLRAHQHVFGDSLIDPSPDIRPETAHTLLKLLNGFLLTTTYKGLVVVVSQNVQEYLGFSEIDLLGHNIFNWTYEADWPILKENLSPSTHLLGPHGELLVPDEPEGSEKMAQFLAQQKRKFVVRLRKQTQRSEPPHFVTCLVEGSLRKSDKACKRNSPCCQMIRRARARGDNPCCSGNDVVFIGIVRPVVDTFLKESELETYRMEYRTRHSVDGEIIECSQKIALVTGYMAQEVNGLNAMNFMHKDDVRWVIIALREMYDQYRLYGESCYRLMTKTGQFIYMKTKGQLEVKKGSRAVTSFICTNTMVGEEEGKHLIKHMKKRFMLMVNNNEEIEDEEINDHLEDTSTAEPPVEDPRQLEKVILHLVTNLPSPQPVECRRSASPDVRGTSPSQHLAIIPPQKERIVNAIEKIYSVIHSFSPRPQREPEILPIFEAESPEQGQLVKLPTLSSCDFYKNRSISTSTNYSSCESVQNSPDSSVICEGVFEFGSSRTSHKISTEGPSLKASSLKGNKTMTGIKRLSDENNESVTKKKHVSEEQETQNNEENANERIFDESLFQIDNALSSLEQTIDPSFPEYLMSRELQELLSDVEENKEESDTKD